VADGQDSRRAVVDQDAVQPHTVASHGQPHAHQPPRPNSGQTELHHDLDALAGTWSASDADIFLATIAPLEQIDPELWR